MRTIAANAFPRRIILRIKYGFAYTVLTLMAHDLCNRTRRRLRQDSIKGVPSASADQEQITCGNL